MSTIINLEHSLKLKVVAEGVETEEQSRLLTCDEMQGLFIQQTAAGRNLRNKIPGLASGAVTRCDPSTLPGETL